MGMKIRPLCVGSDDNECKTKSTVVACCMYVYENEWVLCVDSGSIYQKSEGKFK